MTKLKNRFINIFTVFALIFCVTIVSVNKDLYHVTAGVKVCPGNTVQCLIEADGVMYTSEKAKGSADVVIINHY